MNNEKISVIVPCYNYGRFLSFALDSIAAQTYDNWECIVVDDGSKDTTGEVARSYAEKDARFRYVYQQNKGVAAARNTGIEVATGVYIQFLDADDMLPPQKLAMQLDLFEQHPGTGIVYGDALFFDTNATEKTFFARDGKESSTYYLKGSGQGTDMVRKFTINNFIETSAPLIRKGVIDKVGMFDTGYKTYEDWQYWFRCALSGIAFLYKNGEGMDYWVRYGHTSMMTDKKQLINDGIRIRKYMQEHLPGRLIPYNLFRLLKLYVRKAIS